VSFPRYPAYKHTGVEWLGPAPSHWEVLAIKRLASLQSGNGITAESISDEGDYPVYGGNGIRGFTDAFTHDGVYPIIGRQGALCGNVNYSKGKFWASEHAVVASPAHSLDARWLGETLRAMNLNQYSVSAAQPGLSVEVICNLLIPYPPHCEQQAIASFLNRETTKIDALIAEQQRLIELLQEKRQAVISHAVTKGMNPDAPMKDSGVEWLGQVPEHWGIGQSRRRFALRNERALEGDEQLTASQKYGIVRQADFVEAEGRRVVEVIKGAEILKHVETGDFVISMRSFQGGIEYSPYRGSISSAYVMLSPIKDVHPGFFRWLFKSSPYIQALQSTSNLVRDGQALRFSNFAQVDIPVIPLQEQIFIANFLDLQTAKIDAMIAEQQQLTELLQERRSALISSAVTGQIDVRGLVPSEATA
jgi:type I restriction enzyme S subunit